VQGRAVATTSGRYNRELDNRREGTKDHRR
jgi:hypothetical protein